MSQPREKDASEQEETVAIEGLGEWSLERREEERIGERA